MLVGRMAFLLLLGLFMVPMGGCFHCDSWTRTAQWIQSGVPVQYPPDDVRLTLGDLSGGANRVREGPMTGGIHVYARSNDQVSHDDLVRFAQKLFRDQGWPEPALNGTEDAYCDNDW